MPQVNVAERAVTEAVFHGDRLGEGQWMEQALGNIQLTRMELAMNSMTLSVSGESDSSVQGKDDEEVDATDVEEEEAFLLPYMRTPPEFKEALCGDRISDELREVRDRMETNGLDCKLEPSGAKIFVWPEQYEAIMEAVHQHAIDLKPSHVITVESLMPALMSTIEKIRSNLNVRIRKDGVRVLTKVARTTLNSHASSALGAGDETSDEGSEMEDWKDLLCVKRTFLCSVKVMRNAASVNQSTTEAHGGVNPRRLGGDIPAPSAATVKRPL